MISLTRRSPVELDGAFSAPDAVSIGYAIRAVERDLSNVCTGCGTPGAPIRVRFSPMPSERYHIAVRNGAIEIAAGDALGVIYGLYYISKNLLNVQEFWFWNDQQWTPVDAIPVPEDFEAASEPFAVRYRGWFLNDEVLLLGWRLEGSEMRPWEMAFEALLRCGGNMVIPGTDKSARRNRALASKMGLIITHHHAEPLGAEMFARAYPDLPADYDRYGEKFDRLWREGVQEQKDMRVVWNVGFRGQGDEPFWARNPKYATDEERGRLISSLIRKQCAIVRETRPDAVFCTNLYGEVMELYRKGALDLPDDVIKVWADNGYGKMVTRRQGSHNPRVPALPQGEKGPHGTYYHVSFYDLQAANHITMLVNSADFIRRELQTLFANGVSDYWVINASNVKPHTFYLDAVSQAWRTGDFDPVTFREDYFRRYFDGEETKELAQCAQEYAKCAVAFGEREDEHAAEQFANHGTRALARQWMVDAGKPARELRWACDTPTLDGQIAWYAEKCREGEQNYAALVKRCEAVADRLGKHARTLFADSLLLHARLYALCYRGARLMCGGFEAFCAGDLKRAFVRVGLAAEAFDRANAAMREREHGKWLDFYANECLTDVKQTAWVLRALMGWLRACGDGPVYCDWQREFLYAPEDKKIRLLLNFENHLTDAEIFRLMKEKLGEE